MDQNEKAKDQVEKIEKTDEAKEAVNGDKKLNEKEMDNVAGGCAYPRDSRRYRDNRIKR